MSHLFFIFFSFTHLKADFKSHLTKATYEQLQNGKAIYNDFCFACHIPSNFMVASPKLGDQKEWNIRLANHKDDLDKLVASAWKGKAAMPPKGNCSFCKKADLKNAILYMVNGN